MHRRGSSHQRRDHSGPKSFPVGDPYDPDSGSNVLFVGYMCVVVLEVILIDIEPLQKPWWKVQGVEILAAGVVVLQLLQFSLHHLRFRRSHWVIQWGAWAAYYAPVPLEVVAVGMTLRLRRPLWPVAILFVAGQSDTMAVYSLDDNDSQDVRRFAKRSMCVAYLIVALLQLQELYSYLYFVLETGLLVWVHLKVSSIAMIPSGDICMVVADEGASRAGPSKSQAQKGAEVTVGSKLESHGGAAAGGAEGGVSGASSSKSQAQKGDVISVVGSLESIEARTKAVVAVGSLESLRSAKSGSTTYEDILGLDYYYSTGFQDTSLSAALFLQQLQRYHNPGDPVDSSRANLDFNKLLAGGNHAKALRLVDVQLSFMYDHFFSAHGSPSSASYKLYLQHWVLKIVFLIHIRSLLLTAQQADDEHSTFFAFAVIHLLLVLQLCQLTSYLTSDRFLVSYMCEHARFLASNHSSSTRMPRLLVVLNTVVEIARGSSWQNTLGQYSLLGDLYSPSPPPHAVSLHQLNTWILDRVVTPPELSQKTKGYLRYLLLRQFRQETEIHTVLIWHIATWLCAVRDRDQGLSSSDDNVLAATSLSSYSMYLVAFHPELLPTHHTVATRTFDKAVREAEPYLKEGEVSSKTMYDKIMSGYYPTPMLAQGAQLARLLRQDRDLKYCWNILAYFWAEVMLHLALSGNATAHIEHLAKAKGGEFITRLWVLLSNAGKQKDTTLIKRSVDMKKASSSKRKTH